MSALHVSIQPPSGRLGVLLPGMGAVTSTFISGVELYKKGLGQLVGSMTQNQTIRLGKRYEGRRPLIKDFVPLATPEDLVFGGWDIFPDSLDEVALNCGVLPASLLEPIREELSAIRPMPAVFDRHYVKRLDGPNVKKAASKWDLAEQLMDDMRAFRERNGLDRLVMIWCGSTEILQEEMPVHRDLESLERGLKANDVAIHPRWSTPMRRPSSASPMPTGPPT